MLRANLVHTVPTNAVSIAVTPDKSSIISIVISLLPYRTESMDFSAIAILLRISQDMLSMVQVLRNVTMKLISAYNWAFPLTRQDSDLQDEYSELQYINASMA
ncbi:hypothetical protein NXS19_012814 [Fusarium pseudograminearum]|nr:hypothetical protein NXS19_012814 [Fusarium pseudograminearum]